MTSHGPYRRRRAAFAAALAAEELPPEYYERAVDYLMTEKCEQRDFVRSEFMDISLIEQMLDGTMSPSELHSNYRDQFAAWLREQRKFRVTTTAWALYAADHPEAPRA